MGYCGLIVMMASPSNLLMNLGKRLFLLKPKIFPKLQDHPLASPIAWIGFPIQIPLSRRYRRRLLERGKNTLDGLLKLGLKASNLDFPARLPQFDCDLFGIFLLHSISIAQVYNAHVAQSLKQATIHNSCA